MYVLQTKKYANAACLTFISLQLVKHAEFVSMELSGNVGVRLPSISRAHAPATEET